jgi:hypothetical protein
VVNLDQATFAYWVARSTLAVAERGRYSSHKLGIDLSRHQGMVWFLSGCNRRAALGMRDLVMMEPNSFFPALLL